MVLYEYCTVGCTVRSVPSQRARQVYSNDNVGTITRRTRSFGFAPIPLLPLTVSVTRAFVCSASVRVNVALASCLAGRPVCAWPYSTGYSTTIYLLLYVTPRTASCQQTRRRTLLPYTAEPCRRMQPVVSRPLLSFALCCLLSGQRPTSTRASSRAGSRTTGGAGLR